MCCHDSEKQQQHKQKSPNLQIVSNLQTRIFNLNKIEEIDFLGLFEDMRKTSK
jgi:hypothetical protein